jgi:hypothetical protein
MVGFHFILLHLVVGFQLCLYVLRVFSFFFFIFVELSR